METHIDKMCSWERKKAMFLLDIAEQLDMNLDSYGELNVNKTSGYVYLWLEDYNFSLYMPINCRLVKSDVYALWTNSENGEEIETSIEDMDLEDIEKWAENLEKENRKDE